MANLCYHFSCIECNVQTLALQSRTVAPSHKVQPRKSVSDFSCFCWQIYSQIPKCFWKAAHGMQSRNGDPSGDKPWTRVHHWHHPVFSASQRVPGKETAGRGGSFALQILSSSSLSHELDFTIPGFSCPMFWGGGEVPPCSHPASGIWQAPCVVWS